MTKIMTAANLDHAAGQRQTVSLHLSGTAASLFALHKSCFSTYPKVHDACTLLFREPVNDKVVLVGGKNVPLGETLN